MGVSTGLYMYDVVVKKFTFAISSPDEFLLLYAVMHMRNMFLLKISFMRITPANLNGSG